MPTENNYMNDYMQYEQDHTNRQKIHEKNIRLKWKYGEKLSTNKHITRLTDNIKPYQQPLKEYQQPIAEVLEGDLRKYVLEQLLIQSEKSTSKNMKISYGPRTYRLVA